MDVTSHAARKITLLRNFRWRRTSIFFLLLLFLGVGSCAMPRFIILKDPLTPEEHLNLGVAYEKKGELDAALKEYGLAAKKNPLANLYLGNIYFQKKDMDQAEKYYRRAIRMEPPPADAYNNLAWLYYTKGEKLEEAEKLALKAMELDPKKIPTYQDTLDKILELRRSRLKPS